MNSTDKENLNIHIESILYYTGETFTVTELAKTFGANTKEVEEALEKLGNALSGRGVELMRTNDKVSLGTAKISHAIIEKIRREELDKELSKASMETLACILYKGEITRSEIDFVRGVNSSFILRNLQLRGLITKKVDSKDSRRYVYAPTEEALGFMGVTDLKYLPDYELIHEKISASLVVETVKKEETAE